MNPVINKQIAIVGGGPGGLTLARLLEQGGAQVKVYERDVNKEVRVQGATLDLHEDSGLEALRQAGLMEAFMANYRPGADYLRITDKQGNILYGDEENSQELYFRPEIDRGPLRKILLDSLGPDTVVWNSQFVAMQAAGSGWQLTFQHGGTAYADIVIAADGANSKLRPYVTSIRAFYAGMTMLEGGVYDSASTLPRIHELLHNGKIFALGESKTLIVSSKGDGSLVFYTGGKAPENWVRDSGIDFSDRAQVMAWFRDTFTGWDPLWLQLFEHATLPFIPRPQYCMPLDQQWETLPNITLLGDAAHLMPPYAGEGVNMAMLDALELSQCLLSETFADTHAAIAAYEKQMLARASATAQMTMEQMEAMHSEQGLENMLAMFSAPRE